MLRLGKLRSLDCVIALSDRSLEIFFVRNKQKQNTNLSRHGGITNMMVPEVAERDKILEDC